MADNQSAVDTEKRSSAIFSVIHRFGQIFLQCRSKKQRSDLCSDSAFSHCVFQQCLDKLACAFAKFKDNISCESISNDNIKLSSHDISSFCISRERNNRLVLKNFVCFCYKRASLRIFFTDVQKTDTRILDACHFRSINISQYCILDIRFYLGLGTCA